MTIKTQLPTRQLTKPFMSQTKYYQMQSWKERERDRDATNMESDAVATVRTLLERV